MGRVCMNVIVFLVTIVVTLATTALMCFCVVTDYWEIVSYPLSNIEKILNTSSIAGIEQSAGNNVNKNVSVESLYDEKVIFIKEENETTQIMIQMNAGLWSICYDVSGTQIIRICLLFAHIYIITDELSHKIKQHFNKH